MPELWLQEAGDHFWEVTGGFTSDFEAALLFGLPVTIERIAMLSVHKATIWLSQRGFALSELVDSDRRLRACLVAHGAPRNFVLLDCCDSPAEQRFSLAHE